MRRRVLTGLAIAAVAGIAASATIDSIDVDRDGGVYSLRSETHLAASPEAIRAVLTDYDNFDRISHVYKEFGYLEAEPDGTPVIFTRMEGCVLFFCKSLKRVERLEADEFEHIRTVTLPEQSDFRSSVSEWSIEAAGTGSRVIYTLEMEPDFWVPPLIGPPLLKRTLKRGGTRALDRIESLAQEVDAAAAGA